MRIRKDLEKIAEKNNARVQLVEVPPGPPVLSTLVAEIYGSYDKTYEELLQSAVGGITPASLHMDPERNPLWIKVVLPRDIRSDMISISHIPIRSSMGKMIPLAELVHVVELKTQKPIYHKILSRLSMLLEKWLAGHPEKRFWI